MQKKIPRSLSGLRGRNGASDGAIATVCGHEDKTMILRVYGHAELQPDLLQETVRKANQRAVRA